MDRIVAVVNRDVITEYELQTRVHQVALNLRRQDIGLPPMPQLRRQVLERLILEKAIEQRAQDTGIRVDEQMISASIEQIAQNNHMTVQELRDRLRTDGTSYSVFRDQIRQEILLQRIRLVDHILQCVDGRFARLDLQSFYRAIQRCGSRIDRLLISGIIGSDILCSSQRLLQGIPA